MARWVEEAWVEVPWVEVPLDFLTMGVLGSLNSSWAKSGSWSTCRLSLTIPLQQGEEEEEGKGSEGRERCRRVGRERGKVAGRRVWKERMEEWVEQAVGEGVNALSLEDRGVSAERACVHQQASQSSSHQMKRHTPGQSGLGSVLNIKKSLQKQKPNLRLLLTKLDHVQDGNLWHFFQPETTFELIPLLLKHRSDVIRRRQTSSCSNFGSSA